MRLSFRKWKKKMSVGILVLLETMQVTIERTNLPGKPLVLSERSTCKVFIKPDVPVMADMAESDFNNVPLVRYSRK